MYPDFLHRSIYLEQASLSVKFKFSKSTVKVQLYKVRFLQAFSLKIIVQGCSLQISQRGDYHGDHFEQVCKQGLYARKVAPLSSTQKSGKN